MDEPASHPGYHDEVERVARRRATLWSLDADDPAVHEAPRIGLALSGGGIRSATFALGLMQALNEVAFARHDPLSDPAHVRAPALRSLLARFDYLSTVSGGGYVGAFFCSLFVPGRLLSRGPRPPWPESPDRSRDAAALAFDVIANNPPGRMRREAEAAQIQGTTVSRDARIAQPLAWLRENGRYLAPTGVGDLVYAAALAIRNWLAIQYVLATVIVAALALLMFSRAAIVVALGLDDDTARAAIWIIGSAVMFFWAFPAGVAFWLATPGHGRSDAEVPRWPSLAAWGDLGIGVVLTLATIVWSQARTAGIGATIADPRHIRFDILGLDAFGGFFLVIGVHALLGFAFYAATRGRRSIVEHRVVLTRSLASALRLAALVFLFALADTTGQTVYEWIVSKHEATAALTPASTVAAAIGALIWAVRKGAVLADGKSPRLDAWKLPLDALAGLLAFAIAFALIVFWVVLIDVMVWNLDTQTSLTRGDVWMLAWIFGLSVGVAIVVGRFPAFINVSSLQSIYSARLTRAYLGASNGERLEARVAAESAAKPQGGSVAEPLPTDQITHERYYASDVLAPLHVINVTVNQTTDSNEMLVQRDRKGLPLAILPGGFTIDGLYYPFERGRDADALTIGQWVGTSGAAVATGLGRTTTPGLSLLLGLANVRLGTWWQSGQGGKRPTVGGAPQRSVVEETVSAIFGAQAYLLAELSAQFHGLQRTRQYLSDGGHFDNTGIYELLRPERGIALIVASDAGADVESRFGDFANLIRLARIDYRREIAINRDICKHPVLGRVFGRPDDIASKERSNRCALLYDVFSIDDDLETRAPVCRIVVVKPRLIDCSPLDVRQYAATHATFPSESTAQQFFDEAQWESYRRLGVAVGRCAFGINPDSDPTHAASLWRALGFGNESRRGTTQAGTFTRRHGSNDARSSHRWSMKQILLGALAVLSLGACAHPDGLRPGLTRDQLDARFGRPAATRPEPPGEVRIYTSQPLGQRASAAHLDASGRVTAVEPLLNTEHFGTIRIDDWNKQDVFTHFGPPADVTRTRQYEVWSYRYRESEVWNSLFHVMFDAKGIVRQTQNAPDPMYDPKDRGRL